MQHEQLQPSAVKTTQILGFFVPLGLAASLITLSHVIINSVLSRAPAPELTIAAYTIAASIFSITEKPAFLLRQTTSTLSEDRASFRAMSKVTVLLVVCTLAFGFIIGFTPLGEMMFRLLFNTDDALTPLVLDTYRVLLFVTVFSAIRCLYQGIIIRNMQTKWLTIGMVFRLAAMYGVALLFMRDPGQINGMTGAWIFLLGMAVEALVSSIEGRKIARSLPDFLPQASVRSVRDVFPFYRPLLYSSFISVIAAPSINAMLGKTVQIELSIASYAIALSVVNLVISFFSYVHQIVLNFHRRDARAVFRFTLVVGAIPGTAVILLSVSPLGEWLIGTVIGAQGELLRESLSVLRVMAIFAFVFPWVDYCNGLCMLERKTKIMVWSQVGHVTTVLVILILMIAVLPHWNGMIGALAFSGGLTAELIVLFLLLRKVRKDITLQPERANHTLRG